MPFTAGQLVVHPFHGPAVITAVTTRTVKNVAVSYLELAADSNGVRVAVPVDNATEMGLRPLMTLAEIADVLSLIRQPSEPRERNWSRRVKAYHLLLLTGRMSDRAHVVREILRGAGTHPSNLAEKALLRSAGDPITAEMCLRLEITNEQAWQLLVVAALPDQHPLRDPAVEILSTSAPTELALTA